MALKKPNPNQNLEGAVIVEDQNQTTAMAKLGARLASRRKLLAVLVVILIVIVGGGVGLIQHHTKDKVIFEVAGKQYTESTVKPIAQYYMFINSKSYSDAAKAIFGVVKFNAAAQSLGIQPSQDQLNNARKQLVNQRVPQDDKGYQGWLTIASYQRAVTIIVSSYNPDHYSGYDFIFPFWQHLSRGAGNTPAGYGDKNLIAQDETYAKSRAQYYHDALMNNQLTADQVLAQIKQDAKLDGAGNTSSQFGNDPAAYWRNNLMSDVADYITKAPVNNVSDIQTGKIVADGLDPNQTQVAGFYYFVKVQSGHASGINVDKINATANTIGAIYYGV